MKVIDSLISNIHYGYKQPYIYIWVSKKFSIVYVGMTNSRMGTFGRGIQHCDSAGTLRQKFENHVGQDLDKAYDLKLISFFLPRKKVYYSLERSYREAIEYLVQNELNTNRATFSPIFDVISWVRTSPRVNNTEVKKLSKAIIKKFKRIYPKI